MRPPTRTIAIIGGGYCGATLATLLLRRRHSSVTRIALIERRADVARGVAYQTNEHSFLLNVPAQRMSAEAEPLHFARFAHSRGFANPAGEFLPRALYGEYLQATLQAAEEHAQPKVKLEHLRGHVHAINRLGDQGPYLLSLSDQRQLLAEDVVLACGDPPPTDPPWALELQAHRSYVRDPYGDGAVRAGTQTLLLVGTGLTMADMAVAAAAANPDVQVHAISRHGRLPAVQLAGHEPSERHAFKSDWQAGVHSARGLLQAFRALLREAESAGCDWRDALNVARQAAPGLWQRLSVSERARFLRHLRSRWDAHRHRLPPATAQRLQQLQRGGQLIVHAGRIASAQVSAHQVRVHWRERGSSRPHELLVDQVVNCSGIDARIAGTREPLLRSLLDQGLASPDPLGLGLRTGHDGAVVDSQGRAAKHLFYVGPMLRAAHWEATAVGELRGHVERLAHVLAPVNVSTTAGG